MRVRFKAGYSRIALCAVMLVVLLVRPHGIFAQMHARKV